MPVPFHLAVVVLVVLFVGSCKCQATETPVKSAKFVTCPACRLNYLPEVKRFLKTEIEPGSYPAVTVEYVFGHNPEVVFFDDNGKELYKRRVDDLNYTDLHDLLKGKGFEYKPRAGSTGALTTASLTGWRRRHSSRKLAGHQVLVA